jgi:arginyl-tRNA synthetase
MRNEVKNLIWETVKELQKKGEIPDFDIPEIKIERPEEKMHGDYSTNAALIIAGILKRNPMEMAEFIRSHISDISLELFEKTEAVNPGFINFFISKEYLQKQIGEILEQKDKFGELKIGKGQKVNVEFISANPTGPLHIGNGRGGFCGDVLANILNKAHYKATREYYINDMGRQILFLENSLNGREPSYQNQYIEKMRKEGEKNVKKAVKYIVAEIKKTTERMNIKFDKWVYESHLKRERKEVLGLLEKNNLIYEKEGAVWFKSSEFGDDKDRVLKRAEEKTTYHEETYFLSDVAYLKNKFKRGFDCLIIFLGAEHHGYINRLKAAAEALGYDKERVKPVIMQLVNLLEKGKEVRMSKRSGVYVTLDELMDEVGGDIARFFFLTRSPGSHLLFDLDLAKEQSEKNPVFYVQYAHARICSILKKLKIEGVKLKATTGDLKLLNHPSEANLIKQLIRLPEIVEDTARDYQVQRLPQYAMDLATAFHQFYRDCRVISDDKELSGARLSLVQAAKIGLKNTLDLMGISAPEKM